MRASVERQIYAVDYMEALHDTQNIFSTCDVYFIVRERDLAHAKFKSFPAEKIAVILRARIQTRRFKDNVRQ